MVGYYPKTLDEALKLLNQKKGATIFAGGTDLMVQKKFAQDVIFINQIEELESISKDADNLYLGAKCTYIQLIYADIPEIMKEVFSQIASPAIRNRGTIGGNICNASPAGDSLPMWYAMDAVLKLESLDEEGKRQERLLPIRDFIKGIRKIDRKDNEILTQVILPIEYCNNDVFYYHKKVGARKSEAISKLSFFGLAKIEAGKIRKAGIAFGAVGITVVADRGLQGQLEGMDKKALHNIKAELIGRYMQIVKPIDDQRSTALYRKKVSENLLTDFLDKTEENM
ncbi:MAG: FAD binding domain-containing protein [Candidatus Metalachnospira sp.]|nr:FAD binding domain-containing protein [Candidatus Metalachnospira sp.]